MQPLLERNAAVVLVSAETGAVSEQLAVPKPTKSMICAPVGQAPVSAVVELTKATLPLVALMAIVPVASGVGSDVVPPAPWAC